ncbi:PREDICTED: putative Kunitz-type serine protease inhibitor [Condylura cristata]|uniref:putative Kunitz-type serine protease inhibitor n=1 Tax=Condylura cristata TaxID=143302 RepID=UPI0006438173|nr:PREDICTED: putative Kunitz-type serine protease inhibitor [Condylura cristata]
MRPSKLSTALLVLLTTVLTIMQGAGAQTPKFAPPAFCLEPPFTGPCKARMIRWFFNASSGVCEHFVFGGCRGRRNNFRAEERCNSLCAKNEVKSTAGPEDRVGGAAQGPGERPPGPEKLVPASEEPAPLAENAPEGEEAAPEVGSAPEGEEAALQEQSPEEPAPEE